MLVYCIILIYVLCIVCTIIIYFNIYMWAYEYENCRYPMTLFMFIIYYNIEYNIIIKSIKLIINVYDIIAMVMHYCKIYCGYVFNYTVVDVWLWTHIIFMSVKRFLKTKTISFAFIQQ